ncbi:MAG TPA: tetratricopeptide repeat protein [Verrucomicrobiae bacterium]|nr:tetratricopeptide repeat protein [Verrucomicrobiae bacterium]
MKYTKQSLVADAALVVLVTVVAYLPAFHNGFVVDDVFITNNRLIRAGDGLYRFWFTTEAQDYYPLTWSFWWLQWRLWGTDPAGYHVVNVVLHAADAVLIGLVLRRLKIPGAWLAAMVFALHPVNVATVAWITEQKNTLSMLFSAAAVLLYLQFDEVARAIPIDPRSGPRSGRCWYTLSLLAFLLALLSKTAVVMLPVVLLGCVWWQRGRVRWPDFLRIVPFFALSVVLGLATVWFQQEHVLKKLAGRADGFFTRLLTAGWVPWFYLSKALVPVNLTFIYAKPDLSPARWPSYLPGVMLVICFALFWHKRNSWGRPLLFGFGYFVVTLFPVLGFVDQSFYQITLVADHWQYYSIIGVIALGTAAWETSWRRMTPLRPDRTDWGRYVEPLASMIVLVSLGTATWMRAAIYKNQETLYRDNVAKNPAAWMAHYNLGLTLWREGRFEDAITSYKRAIHLKSDYTEVHNNFGVALAATGNLDGAVAEFLEALRLFPGNAEAHNNLGLALARQGKVEPAITSYEQALDLNPNYVTAHDNLAKALLQQGRIQDAIKHYQRVVELQPDYPGARQNLWAARQALKHPQQLPCATIPAK